MAYFEYKIQIADSEKREIAIALLSDLELEGFQEEDQVLIAISREELDQNILGEVMQVIDATYTKSVLEDKNWNEQWESDFQPIHVHYPTSEKIFAHVRAHFHPPIESATHDVVITPKMSFGTGHHATTYGMMAYMSTLNFRDSNVVDFGTGTGVLAILAEKLGAKKVLALDNDPWCIRNAEENALINHCTRLEVKLADKFETKDTPDVILANINLNIIKSNLVSIVNAAGANTTVLFSGILDIDEQNISSSLNDSGLHIIDLINNKGWLIIAAKKR